MHPKSPKWLDDVATAYAHIVEWTAGLSQTDYEANAFVRAAVERQFEIVGEALLRLDRADPQTASRIGGYRRIIASATESRTVTTPLTTLKCGRSSNACCRC